MTSTSMYSSGKCSSAETVHSEVALPTGKLNNGCYALTTDERTGAGLGKVGSEHGGMCL